MPTGHQEVYTVGGGHSGGSPLFPTGQLPYDPPQSHQHHHHHHQPQHHPSLFQHQKIQPQYYNPYSHAYTYGPGGATSGSIGHLGHDGYPQTVLEQISSLKSSPAGIGPECRSGNLLSSDSHLNSSKPTDLTVSSGYSTVTLLNTYEGIQQSHGKCQVVPISSENCEGDIGGTGGCFPESN
jgi:hypothetical protein